ncbi:tRNA 4-thiouridine(8) synthase ThiI [candidate division WOR-3 bacterium]|nr:tRNA 4-thiouridine(8) synthase ThiI [candidate division WOR-3 bacterium]
MKVVVLYSGGLDSTLALYITKEWDAKVFPLYMSHKFLSLKNLPETPDLKTIDITKEFIDILRNPQHGYGKTLNPCVDCRILMLKKAKKYMKKIKADFIVTGEVLDQRPMSQHFDQLMLSDKAAGVEGMVVRPLSGGLLPATIPEKKGLVDRNLLLKIKGRSRKFTLSLAQTMDLTKFSSPSGGCLLTDPGFCRRVADLMRCQEKLVVRDIELLKIGRLFRLSPETKLIVGRNETENKSIENLLSPQDFFLYVPDTGSPNAILVGDKKYIKIAATITARYSDKKNEKIIEVFYKHKGKTKKIRVKAMDNEEVAKWRI